MIDRYLSRKTDGVLTNSSAIVDFYVSRGIPFEKFHVIPNGVEPSKVQPISREEAAQRMHVDPQRKIIGAVGRLWLQKGYKDMIWAAEMLRVSSDKTTFVIIGDGPERQRLEHYRDQVRAAKEIRFLGHRTDVAQLMPHFDCLWNASLYEGQSNTILEAMQAGVPVIASDIPGNRDLIEHEKTGMLFPVGELGPLVQATLKVMNSESLRAELIQQAKDAIQNKFSISKMVQVTSNITGMPLYPKGLPCNDPVKTVVSSRCSTLPIVPSNTILESKTPRFLFITIDSLPTCPRIPTSMHSFEYVHRTRLVFGAGKLSLLGKIAREDIQATRAMIISDRGVVAAGHFERGRKVFMRQESKQLLFMICMRTHRLST